MMQEWLAMAERNRQERVSRRAGERQRAREERYKLHPKLRELDDAVRLARVSAVTDGFLAPSAAREALEKAEEAERERAGYLSRTGLEPSEPGAYCEVCGDAGWHGNTPCECLKALYVPIQRAALSREIDLDGQSFERFDLSLFRAERLDGEDYAPREMMEEILDIAREYCAAFGTHRRNLFLNGGVGTGKTYLSACVLGAVSDQAFWAEYVTAIRFLQCAEAEQFGRVYPDERGFRRFLHCDLLVLDDLGTEYLSPFAQSALYDLFNTRLQQRRCTLVTSNLTDEQLETRYLPQTASRLRGEYELLYLHGEDLRSR